jgi:ubiquinone/menaquinone biosynthesis C-methylase UbiE
MADNACGPGIVTPALAERAQEVMALDLTPQMLEMARERSSKAGRTIVVFREGSATALPFPDASLTP